jgi:hypothetical protein
MTSNVLWRQYHEEKDVYVYLVRANESPYADPAYRFFVCEWSRMKSDPSPWGCVCTASTEGVVFSYGERERDRGWTG